MRHLCKYAHAKSLATLKYSNSLDFHGRRNEWLTVIHLHNNYFLIITQGQRNIFKPTTVSSIQHPVLGVSMMELLIINQISIKAMGDKVGDVAADPQRKQLQSAQWPVSGERQQIRLARGHVRFSEVPSLLSLTNVSSTVAVLTKKSVYSSSKLSLQYIVIQ